MKKVIGYSLKKSVPILISFFPVGIAYGILMNSAGYNWIWTGLTSVFVYAGSLQYLMISFFAGGTTLLSIGLMAFLLNSRHIFYGIPFIEKWKGIGLLKGVLIFLLTDEAFSLHCSNDFDDGNKKNKALSYVFCAIFIYLYWILFSIMGALIGELINFNTEGMDFALTALFIVILIDQLRGSKNKFPALVAGCSSLACILIFGANNFILPSLVITVAMLFILKKPFDKIYGGETNDN